MRLWQKFLITVAVVGAGAFAGFGLGLGSNTLMDVAMQREPAMNWWFVSIMMVGGGVWAACETQLHGLWRRRP